MGLLTDPSAGQGHVIRGLINHHGKLGIFLYIAGIVWFCLLAYSAVNLGTHFSENALLPGLVRSEFRDETSARQFHAELVDEMKKYDNSIPYPWLLAKFRQMGLDTYTHNFTLNYPLGKSNRKYVGKNVYGILRAARAASTEALVLSVPYRPPSNINPTTAPSIAIMLAFAKFANKEKYWSKDIIFLITEHEQLGIQAWLEAYYDVVCGEKGILDHGELSGRAGAIQAAINLEFHAINIAKIDVKIEGLNGQLPNLDLFNLATRMCTKQGAVPTFKNRENKLWRYQLKDWSYTFTTLVTMVFSQATGIPTGNHGLFHRFGIQALTLEGFGTKVSNINFVTFLSMGRILEDIFRSLNNLLERFHQSYFFYLLPSSERFVSIGLYMPVICLIAGALFVKASGKWYQLYESSEDESETGENDDIKEKTSKKKAIQTKSELKEVDKEIDVVLIVLTVFFIHVIGIIVMNSPRYFTIIGAEYGFNTELSVYGGFTVLSLILLSIPLFVTNRTCYKSMSILNIFALLELGTALICLSMINFSLGFLLGTLYVPFVLLVNPDDSKILLKTKKFLWFMMHPLIVATLIVFTYTFVLFAGEPFKENIVRGFVATQQAIVFSIVDSMIYSNWLYNMIVCMLLPNWLCFWCVLFYNPNEEMETANKEKKDK